MPPSRLISSLNRLGIDTLLLLLLLTIILAAFFPVRGAAAELLALFAKGMIALLFFLYGARLDSNAVMAGLRNWRLQGIILFNTFVVFPLLGLGLTAMLGGFLSPDLIAGLLFLSVLPSTIQSSIALTGLAQGNVPAAICGASLSNMVGVPLTPLLLALLLHTSGLSIGLEGILNVASQILLPFALGQIARPKIAGWIAAHGKLTLTVDRASILLIVYSAFSAGMVSGVWQEIAPAVLALIVVVDGVLLALAMLSGLAISRAMGLPPADRISVLFCGGTKSLASGLLIANILIQDGLVSVVILPTMVFHQMQIVVSSLIAQRAARRVRD